MSTNCVSSANFSVITAKHPSSPKFKTTTAAAAVHFASKMSSSFERKLKQVVIDATETIKSTSVKLLDDFVDLAFKFVDQPLLPSQSNFAPVEEVAEAIPVQDIQGCVPIDFPDGVYIRNGPNPLFGGYKSAISVFGKSSHTWIEGEGMLHALYLKKKKKKCKDESCWTVSYKNRYLQPETFKLENQRNKPAFLPAIEGDSLAVFLALVLNLLRFGKADKDISNTNIIKLGDKYYATAENHTPVEFDITTLKTIGTWHLHSTWNRPFTSHPKKIPSTGEVVTYGVSAQRPYMELGIISPNGWRILHRVDPNLDRCSLCHDIGVTERYNVILDFPLTLDINRLIRGGPLIRYNKEDYARIGVMPRYGDRDSIVWFEVEPCTVFHIVNCFEKCDEIIVRACKAGESIIPGPEFGLNKFEWFSRGFKKTQRLAVDDEKTSTSQDGLFFTKVYEWRLNIKTGQVNGGNVTGTDFSMDFPFINESYIGLQNKYGYTQVLDSTTSSISGMAKYGGLAKIYFADAASSLQDQEDKKPEKMKKVEYHKFPEGTFCSGATFVPKDGGGIEEDDGWIITFLHNEINETSQVHIIDGKKFSEEAVAKMTLPVRVPYGFHGAFMPL